MDIEKSCKNCEYAMEDKYEGDHCWHCNFKNLRNFVPSKDLVELHGKLRKAVEAIELIGELCGDAVFEREDNDNNWYSVDLSEFTKEVLEAINENQS